MAETKIIKRKRNIGLKDIYVAKVTSNTSEVYATETPVKLARAINAKITDSFTSEKLYSDDSVEDVLESYEGSEIELEVNKLAPDDLVNLYDTIYKDGYFCKSGSDVALEVAIGWRSKKLDGTYDFEWYYCGKFTERPERELSTKADKTETKTNTIKGSFYEREKEDTIDGKKRNLYSILVDESNLVDADTSAKEAIKNWFSEVQEYSAATTK